jgi:hypothetical protein
VLRKKLLLGMKIYKLQVCCGRCPEGHQSRR